MDTSNPSTLLEILAGGSAALIAAVYGLQKFTKGWKVSATESSVMTIMHTELERMASHNATLALELNKLQTEIITLNQQMRSLILENQRLHSEIGVLTSQVSHLQKDITQSIEANGRVV